MAGSNNCVVSRGGTDVFNVASGATTLTLSASGLGMTLRYAIAGGIWYSMDATPLASLSGAYAPIAGPVPALYAASADPRFVSATAGRKVTSFTLALADAGTIIEAEAATALTVTVPPASSVAFVDNTLIEICQTGDGQVTVAPGVGVTLRAPGGLKTRAQWSSVSLRRRPGSGRVHYQPQICSYVSRQTISSVQTAHRSRRGLSLQEITTRQLHKLPVQTNQHLSQILSTDIKPSTLMGQMISFN